ncbi:high-affinity branched-chain amino acid ABC transporter permease LivM [Paramagnetospirillum magneticum]|uniref:ABC-type branched-chain amino acid transport system, permease component n=1 Tax=Paramagnetospirillum magneticum (strain ATCC 700264 / AMB-1) TaxID=342108 RepID=Q2W6B7_PARM1|nr:high-affinity branched-chain amino acid ABC transporter permease LivM [Paramagnetospirillum magneticum]BAE50608.1 ABC-type branched-chain amino acid transport system, permease component [Paramagnetospirillum magneticum AMB-1]
MGGKTARALVVDALLGGVVAAAMALPMLGVRLEDGSTGLSLSGRLDWVAWAAGSVAGARLLIGLLRLGLAGRGPSLPAPPRAMMVYVGWAMVAFALILPFLPFSGRNLVDKATLVLIYVMLGWGLNIVVGLAGLLDLGFVAFYAVGAYSYALLSQTFGLSFWVCLPLAGLLAAAFGMVLGFPVLRLRGDYIAIVTMGLGEIVRVVLQNWQDVTGGPNGISGIERPSLFGLSFKMVPPEGSQTFAEFFGLDYSADHRVIFLYFLILALALLTNVITLRIRRLPVGRAWEALREDEIACRSLGINPTLVKLSAFATGAMFAGFAGSFFATRQGFISPESFTFIESAVILAIVVLGGMGSQIGIVLAALLLVGLPEWFRELQQFRMLAFGGAMVLIMLWKPAGLLSTREPTIRLGEAK